MEPDSSFLRRLNSAGRQPSIENYYTIAGTIEFSLTNPLYYTSLLLHKEPNDGVVQVPSVQVLTYATHIEAAVDHFHYDDDAYVFNTVVNILRGTSSSASPNLEIQQSGTNYQESALIEDSVTIGDEDHHSIPVDYTVSEVHFILASDEGELDFTLTSPGGTLITPTVAANDPLITYTNAITTLIGYDITSPEHGNWTAHVAISGTVPSEVSYAMLTLFDSELGLSILLDEDVYQINDSVPLTAELMYGPNPIIGATVTAQVVSPSGSTEVLSLYDDGSHGDAQANDGIYTNLYMDTTATGAYEVTVTTSGTINDEQFVRETATTIWVECVVTTTADSGPGSLRQCILDAQSGDTITFDLAVFPPGSPSTITPTSGPLPDISQGALMIDASNTGVILDGSALSDGHGLHITSDGNVIRGLQVLHFPGSGIQIDGGASHNLIGGSNATPGGTCSGDCSLISGNAGNGVSITGGGTIGNTVSGNYIGTNISGTAVISNTGDGVDIGDGAQYNTIADNLISGNGWMGVSIAGTDTMSNTVKGNLIGVDVNGTADLGNAKHGVLVQSGAQGNVIGGATSGERNIISANHDGSGIRIEHVDTIGNVVIGNFIGTDVNGIAALGNAHGGVSIDWGAQQNRIGGTTAGEKNLISGNDDSGVSIGGGGTMSNTVSGNYIGTDVNGTTGLGNAWMGVDIRGGAQATTVGGRTAGERNIISSNGFVGVGIWDAGTDNNVVIGNYVGTDVNGTAELGNESAGVRLGHGPERNIVGGATSGERNIISGNGRGGVEIGGAHNNLIIGNFIGTDVNGTAALSNVEWGISINDAGQSMATTLNVIESNLISGNECNGVDLYGADTVSNTVRGNLIGTDAAGTGALGNGCQGIWFGGGAHHNTIGGSTVQDRNIISGNNWGVGIEGVGTTNNTVTGNLIGTDISGAVALGNNNAGVVSYNGSQRNIIGPENTVAYNSTDGVLVYGSTCLGNTITQNSIHGNARLGIELDNGGNSELAAPVITGFDLGAGVVTGTACANCTVEVFSDSSDEGEVYEGQTTADGAGDFTCNTSEFSDPAPPVNTPPTLSDLPNQIFDHSTSPTSTIDLWAYVADAETPTNELTCTIEGTPPAGAGVTLDDCHHVTINPSTDWCGRTDVTIRVTDPGGLWDSDTFRVAVTWSCQGPLPVAGQHALQDEPITIDLTPYEPQVGDGTGLSWYVTGEDHCTVSGEHSADDVLTFTPQASFVGSDTVTLRMVYPWGSEATQELTLTWGSGTCDRPGVPVLVAPVDGSAAGGNRPTFEWDAVTGAEEYQIQVDDDADFSSPERDETTASTEYTPASGLSGGVHYWRVRASNGCGAGVWSVRREFTVLTASPLGLNLHLPVVAREYR
jgi:hypothetical protein